MEDLDLEIEGKRNWQFEAMYHKHWLGKLKRETKARHVYFVTDRDTNFIQIHYNNDSGGVDTIKYKLECEPRELRDFDYQSLIDTLKNRDK